MNKDFNEQARFIGKRFIKRGYDEDFINQKIEEVTRMERTPLFQDRSRNERITYELPIILDYNVQHKQVEKIFKKHWSILRADTQLCTILPVVPKFTYRRAPTLRDMIAKISLILLINQLGLPSFRKKFFFPVGDAMHVRIVSLMAKRAIDSYRLSQIKNIRLYYL